MDIQTHVETHQERLYEDLLALLAVNSVAGPPKPGMPNGEKVHEALEKTLALGAKYGFRTFHVEGHAGVIEYGEGEDYVAVLGHLDVVPPGTGWRFHPQGERTTDRIYGRGAMDDKGPMMAALHGLLALKETAVPMKRRVRLIFGTSEETGGPDIATYLKTQPQPVAGFTPDAEFPAIHAEMGILVLRLEKAVEAGNVLSMEGGEAVNMVPQAARMSYSAGHGPVEKTYAGKSAHGSIPHRGVNAIVPMVKEALEIADNADFKQALSAIWYNLCQDLDGKAMGIDFEDADSGKMVLNFGGLSYRDGKLTADINLRYPVSVTEAAVTQPIRKIFQELGFTLRLLGANTPLFYPRESPLVETLMEVYTQETGDRRPPLSIGGGTYAKEMDNIVAFGPQFPGTPDVIHKPDEYITLEELKLCTRIYAKAIRALAEA